MANPQPNIWHAPMPLICSSFEPGHLDDVIEAMPDNDYRTIALAEAAYFRGNADEACRLFTIHGVIERPTAPEATCNSR